ncbi:hypothetical protein HGI81_05630 [Olsenella sp. KGMB02461]|nr:hypothetical protein [Olsenella sp. KGMB02461]
MIDPTALVISLLQEAFPAARVSSEVPSGQGAAPEGDLIIVGRSGGADTTHLLKPEMEIVVWSSSDAKSSALAYDCLHALQKDAKTHPHLTSADAVTNSRDPWGPEVGRYRILIDLVICP